MQEIAAVLVRSLAYVLKPMIEAFALRNCVRRRSGFHVRIGNWFELRTTKAEEFDRNR